MATITVLVGKEEKEISGLTRKTTSQDVIEALLIDLHNERTTAANATDLCIEDIDLGDINESDIYKLVKDYVIFETWRGCEKPLLPQTRMLTVWKAWGKEQNHVKFTLKKYKSFAICHQALELQDESQGDSQSASENKQLEATHYVHKLSHGQKKRIRRSLLQYQRAVKQAHQGSADGSNNGGKQASRRADRNTGDRALSSRQKSTDSPMITLTEEQFVDAVVPDPENVLRSDGTFGRNTLSKRFNRERCTYRRPHHRRLSLMMDDSDCATDQNGLLSFSHKLQHYPYCSKNKRRSNAKRTQQRDRKHARSSKRLKNHKVQGSRYNTDSTSSGSFTLSSDDEFKSHSDGEDADDEKSIMAGFVGSIPGQNMSDYSNIVLPDVERLISGAVSGNTATNTDSSSGVTTCSETSNTSGFSFTTTSSSETSVSADLEAYFAKRSTAATAAAKAKSSEKSKSGAAKLFKISKPAQSIIGSFKKKKKTAQSAQTNSSLSSKPVQTNCTANDKSTSKLSTTASRIDPCLAAEKKLLDTETEVPQKTVACEDNRQLPQKKNSSLEEQAIEDDPKAIEELQQLVLTQQRTFGNDSHKITYASCEIEKLETVVQQWKNETNKTAASLENKSVHNIAETEYMNNSICTSRTPCWIQECMNVADLEEYLSTCERVVAKQLQIEENRRTAEILLQKVKEEMWKVSESAPSVSAKNPLRIANLKVGNHTSDDDKESSLDTLSVSSGKTLESSSLEDSNQDDPLEIERTRTELEASLYLGLRLSTEIEEIEKLMNTSRHLVQSKGESLLSLVRELAQSKEGISPDLWEEYGDLLAAYDEEVSLQQYLAVCAESDLAKYSMSSHDGVAFDQHSPDVDPMSPTTNALHHALSPWLWCRHCKQELEKAQMNGDTAPTDSLSASSHWLSHSAFPDSFSDLPLPSPSSFVLDSKLQSVDQQRIPSLLPMPPVPACNDSDYEEIAEKRSGHDSAVSATSTIITTEDVIPRGIVLRLHPSQNLDHRSSPITRPGNTLDLLSSRNCSSNPEDSGNASAGSTASFTSANSDITDVGSRNSSCDGGSPRPSSVCAESQDSAHSSPFFTRGTLKRSSEKHKFIFPQFKRSSKTETTKNNNALLKPPLPPKSGSRVLASPPGAKKSGQEVLGKLVRSNSGRTKRITRGPQDLMCRRATSFGKGPFKTPNGFTNQITGILKRPIVHNSHCNIAQIKNTKNVGNILNGPANGSKNGGPSNRYNFSSCSRVKDRSSPFLKNKETISYDNDSDTGLSSLHSTDSYDKLTASTGETLV